MGIGNEGIRVKHSGGGLHTGTGRERSSRGTPMHSLLDWQLRKVFAGAPPPRGERWDAFLRAVEAAYIASDEDLRQMEEALRVASAALVAHNRRLEKELEDRKRLELELRLGEKLRAVGQLAAGVAHEINTPVQFVGDSLHFLRMAFAEIGLVLDAEEQRTGSGSDAERLQALKQSIDLRFLRAEIPRALARCEQGIERVTRIVCAMKELAHPDATQQRLGDINTAIEHTLILAANEIKYVAEVHLQLGAARPVMCNIGEIQQVLLNLIVNAGHAVAERVGKSGRKGNIRVATREEAADIVVTVADDGVGIPEDLRQRIFEPFFTTKPVGKGSGQGLSIARSLVVDRHGGQLTFESTPDRGTTFTMRLPVEGKAMASAPEE